MRQHPQTEYTGLQNSLQQEWYFFQNITPRVSESFCLVDEALQHVLLPALLRGAISSYLVIVIARLPVKQSGLTLPGPTLSVSEHFTASCVVMGHLVAALQG